MSEPDESSAGDPLGSEQFRALYLAPFSAGFGLATLITLLPKFADTLDASGTTTGRSGQGGWQITNSRRGGEKPGQRPSERERDAAEAAPECPEQRRPPPPHSVPDVPGRSLCEQHCQ